MHALALLKANLANKWSSHSQNQPDQLLCCEEFLLPLSTPIMFAYLFSIYTISGVDSAISVSFLNAWILVPVSIYNTLKLALMIALVNISHVVQALHIITVLQYNNRLSCWYKIMAPMSQCQ